MPQNSPGSLFATVGIFLAIGFAGVYAIKNREALLTMATQSADHVLQAARAPSAEQDSQPAHARGDVELTSNDIGHFETRAEINGGEVDVMVDTGATHVALTFEDAERAGLLLNDADFTEQVQTANGVARIALVTLETVSIGDITVKNVQGAVAEQGKLHKTLLGMSFLGRLSRVEMGPKTLALHQ